MTRNPASRARAAGDNAEAAIERACASYARSGLALVEKRHAPVRIIGPVRAGRFAAVFAGKAPVDFDGILRGGRAVAFELKRTASATSLPLEAGGKDRLRPEQVDALAARHALGALVGVVVALGPRWFWLTWPAWLRCVDDAAAVGRVSLPIAAMVAHGVEMERAGQWLPAALDSEVG